jgi:hypothetical protein
MNMGSTEEHSLPTEGGAAASAIGTESQTYRDARLWVQMDGAAHDVRTAVRELKAWAAGFAGKLKNKSHTQEGSQEGDSGDEIVRELTRAIVNLGRSRWRVNGPQNGDSGSEKGSVHWPTVLSALSVAITLGGVIWKLGGMDTKIDSVKQAQAVETQQRATERNETLELIRQANERINRLEDRDRHTGYSNP